MQEKYFLQVCRDKLTDYIMKAIICPDDFMGEECHIDTQSSYTNVLLLSNSIIKNLEHFEEVLLEIILTENELKDELKQSDVKGVFYFQKPLPISRIKKIYVQNEKVKEHILRKIDTNQKGFIPEFLIEIKNFEDKLELPNINIEKKDYKKKVNIFNKLLGMLAYMKNSDYYYSDINKSFQNYSSNYFSILNKFNNFTDISTNDFLHNLKSGDIQDQFVNLIMKNERLNKNFIETLIEKEENKEIKENLIKLINDPLSKFEVLKKMRDKDIYFYICMVYINADKYSSKLSSLKSLLSTHVPYSMAEKALAYLGLYYGYEILDANEEVIIKDKYLKTFIKNNHLNTKFLLSSKFDYFVIESVYRYVFNDNKTLKDEFNYLDVVEIPFKNNDVKIDDIYERKVLNKCCDEEHFELRKRNQKELINYKINKYDDEIFADKFIIVIFNKYFTETKDVIPIKKEELIEELSKHKMTKAKETELLNAIKMDGL